MQSICNDEEIYSIRFLKYTKFIKSKIPDHVRKTLVLLLLHSAVVLLVKYLIKKNLSKF